MDAQEILNKVREIGVNADLPAVAAAINKHEVPLEAYTDADVVAIANLVKAQTGLSKKADAKPVKSKSQKSCLDRARATNPATYERPETPDLGATAIAQAEQFGRDQAEADLRPLLDAREIGYADKARQLVNGGAADFSSFRRSVFTAAAGAITGG